MQLSDANFGAAFCVCLCTVVVSRTKREAVTGHSQSLVSCMVSRTKREAVKGHSQSLVSCMLTV